MTTIKDIARECGVSINTVSSVLNNKTGEVSQATRTRILGAMRRLDYRPSAAARRMVGRRTTTLGIADEYAPASSPDPYKTQIIGPIIHTARAARWDVLCYSGHVDTSGHIAAPGQTDTDRSDGFPGFLDGRCDGLLCFTGSIAPDEVETILRTNLPVIFIGNPQDMPDELCQNSPEGWTGRTRGAVIDVDNAAGAYLGVTHLIQKGHTRIAMLQGLEIAGNRSRVAGYQQALAAANLPVDETLLFPTRAWEQAGYETGLQILSQPAPVRPTAVFCFNDVLAFGLLRAVQSRGVRCPEDLSVVGFDDVFAASVTTPPLTTVRQPLAQIGQRAVHILLEIIAGTLPRDHCEIVPPSLVVRASTAPPGDMNS